MEKILFDKFDGNDVYLYTIGDDFLNVGICDFGARIVFIKVGGTDIALGFDSVGGYINSGTYAGATIGRVCNRIKRGVFTLNGKSYSVACNENENHLHGGKCGFDKKLFKVISHSENSVAMRYVSAGGEEGYPGNLELKVKFEIDGKSLKIAFDAVSDADTLWNPTNHTYFNLDGESARDCFSNVLTLNADAYTEIDDELIPTGRTFSVKNTRFDFTEPKPIGRDLSSDLSKENGYDHNYILSGEYAARIESKKTSIAMEIFTDMPCLQFYSGGAIKPCRGKTVNYGKFSGFCLEPQFCPNAVNMTGFEAPLLEKNKPRSHYIVYKFYR